MRNHEAIAIVGIGCRFPGAANNPSTYWELLKSGRDAISEIPPDRWSIAAYYDPVPGKPGKSYSRWGGFVENIDRFDPMAFGISPREAEHMDPQQRMLLETSWEAFEDAGYWPDPSGSNMGVFIGISHTDYQFLQSSPGDRSGIEMHTSSGQARSIAANRISYIFNLLGPSIAVDTACSSSLTAVHLACRSLAGGECETALVGGSNSLLNPDGFIGFSRAAMLSVDGRCKAFDASANGFVRAEGAGAILLKKLSRALADGDRIYAVILGTATNQDGHTSGLTVPSETSQAELVRQAYEAAGVAPHKVDYVEAHGTGTAVGDPIEARALGRTLGEGRSKDQPCLVGSVKTQIGHLEAASGIAGLIKVALTLHHRQIPASLHFRNPNPTIPFDDLKLRVANRLQSMAPTPNRLIAGINSFGFGGANAHAVLATADPDTRTTHGKEKRKTTKTSEAPQLHGAPPSLFLLPLSARSKPALQALAKEWIPFLQLDGEGTKNDLRDICYTAATRRTHHPYRLALVAGDRNGMIDGLRTFAENESARSGSIGHAWAGKSPKLAFVFSGQGPQWLGMGRELFATECVFRKKLEEIDALVQTNAGWSLIQELHANESGSRLHVTAVAQPAIFGIQVGLAELWKSWGVRPDAVVGHSVGEVAAAHIAGALDLEAAVKVIVERGRCMEDPESRGKMLALGMSASECKKFLDGIPESSVNIAAINSSHSVTLAGDAEPLTRIEERARRVGCFASLLAVEYAFHSPRMEASAARLRSALAGISARPTMTRLISTVTGRPPDECSLGADHWANSVRQPVEFAAAILHLMNEGFETFLELSPHPVLARSIQESFGSTSKECRVITSLSRNTSERACLWEAAGALHAQGVSIRWPAFVGEEGWQVSLPTYPWQRDLYWHEAEECRQARMPSFFHPLLQNSLRSAQPTWETRADVRILPYLEDHRVQGYLVFPGAAYVEMALGAAYTLFGNGPCLIEEVEFLKALLLSESGQDPTRLQLVHNPEDSTFSIHARVGTFGNGRGGWTKHSCGKLRQQEEPKGVHPRNTFAPGEGERIDVAAMYSHWNLLGLQFGPAFRAIRELWRRGYETLGRIELDSSIEIEGYRIHPTLLDACFQVLSAGSRMAADGKSSHSPLYLPVRIDRLHMIASGGRAVWAHARLTRQTDRVIEGDVRVIGEDGQLILDLHGFRCQAVEASHRQSADEKLEESVYELGWEGKPLPGEEITEPDFIPALSVLTSRALRENERLVRRSGLDSRRRLEVHRKMNQICEKYIARALLALGWQPKAGQHVAGAALITELGILPKYQRLLERYLGKLERMGLLASIPLGNDGGFSWRVSAVPDESKLDPLPLWRETLAYAPNYTSELTLLAVFGSVLSEILCGAKDPVQVGFAHSGFSTLEHLYRDGAWCRPFNVMLQEAVATVIAAKPRGRRLRILELGAGTGGLTSHILPLLPQDETEYVFSDLSAHFFSRAEQKFQAYPFVTYQILDIDGDPVKQGFMPGSFDIVLAADVLHATLNLRDTLQRLQLLMVPGGLLGFIEVTNPPESLDLIFGLMDGWWRFEDYDLRPNYPLLSVARWQQLLSETGFSELSTTSRGPGHDAHEYHHVFLAKTFRAPLFPGEEESIVEKAEPASHSIWLAFTDQQGVGASVAERLRRDGDRCITVAAGSERKRLTDDSFLIRDENFEDVAWVTREALGDQGSSPCGILQFWPLDCERDLEAGEGFDFALEAAQRKGAYALAFLCRGFDNWPGRRLPDLWIITRGAQAAASSDTTPSLLQTPVLGVGRVLISERPDITCRMVDLDPFEDQGNVSKLYHELRARTDETEIAFRAGGRFVQRLMTASVTLGPHQKKSTPAENLPFVAETLRRGVLDQFIYRATSRKSPGPNQVEIEVSATAMNFRDVMKGLAIYPVDVEGDSVKFGDECSGRIASVGSDATQFKVGDEVFCVGEGNFASHVITHSGNVFLKPSHLTFEEASTLPICFLTAGYALNDMARLSQAETVLIHSATGGVGLAAIQLARLAGAEIIATAGSQEKVDFLKWLGVKHVLNSRSLAFADEVMEITKGKGVDVILNSLSGPALARGVATLAPFGRFLELGKSDIYQNSKLSMFLLRKNISFFTLDLGQALIERKKFVRRHIETMIQDIVEGRLHPLPLRVFPDWDMPGAFRHMSQARHIGKVVLTLENRRAPILPKVSSAESSVIESMRISADGTYLITGGLGGFGLRVALWLVGHGAKNLMLMGRRGAEGAEAKDAVERLRSLGAHVVVVCGDVTQQQDLATILKECGATMPPLKGVIHAAMVLDDAFLAQLDPKRFQRVVAPKAVGAWNLHVLTRDLPLDFFVMFSSVSGITGNPGQGSYAAANTFLDGLAHYRRALGLPALTVDWGMMAEVGYVAQHPDVLEMLERQGTFGIQPDAALGLMARLLQADFSQAIVFRLDKTKWARFFARHAKMPRYSRFISEETTEAGLGEAAQSIRSRLLGAPATDRHAMLEAFLREQASQVLRTSETKINSQAPLNEAGLDSLMAVELMNRVEAGMKLAVPAGNLMAGRSIAQIASDLIALLAREEPGMSTAEDGAPVSVRTVTKAGPGDTPAPAAPTESSEVLLGKLNALSDADVERLLAERIGNSEGRHSKRGLLREIIRREASGQIVVPLSFSQQELWSHSPFPPEDPSNHLHCIVHVEGPVDLDVFQKCINEVAARHESLRTSFEELEGQFYQVISQPKPVPFRVEHGQETAVLSEEDTSKPFDLAIGPLMRFTVLRLSPGIFRVLLTVHHAVFDGWSFGVLFREIFGLYALLRTGGSPRMMPPVYQARQHARAWTDAVSGSRLEPLLAFWKTHLEGPHPATTLSSNGHSSHACSRRSAIDEWLDVEETEHLKAVARQNGVTLFMALHSAFAVLVARRTGQENIVVGSPVANRHFRDSSDTIGYLANNLVFRFQLQGDPSFREILRRVKDATINGLNHQDLPFSLLVRKLCPEWTSDQPLPVFRLRLALQNYPLPTFADMGMTASILVQDSGTSRFDLALEGFEDAQGLRLAFRYRTSLFEEAEIRSLSRQFVGILRSLEGDLDRSLSSLGRRGDG